MNNTPNLKRFLEAQASDYATALMEISKGRKRSHWMWYIFPQWVVWVIAKRLNATPSKTSPKLLPTWRTRY